MTEFLSLNGETAPAHALPRGGFLARLSAQSAVREFELGALAAEMFGVRAQRQVLENSSNCGPPPRASTDFRRTLYISSERPPDRKKLALHAYLVHPQHRPPDVRNVVLDIIARRGVRLRRCETLAARLLPPERELFLQKFV